MSLAVQPTGTLDARVGGRIRIRRRLLGIGQDAVAASLGLSVDEVRRIESGQRRLSPEQAVALTELLDMSADFLLGDGEDQATLQSAWLSPGSEVRSLTA